MIFNKKTLSYLVIIIWIPFIIWAFWSLQYKNYTLFIKNGTFNEAKLKSFIKNDFLKHASKFPQKYDITIYNFLDSSCVCSRYASKHIQDITKKYAGQNIAFILISQNARENKPDYYTRIEDDPSLQLQDFIPATPSVAVVDKQGRLAYFGPYSSDYYCGTGKDSYVEKIIYALSTKKNVSNINLSDFGCFCPIESNNKEQTK